MTTADRSKPGKNRRTFTAAQGRAFVAEYDKLENGQKGAWLRERGLHSNQITNWRRKILETDQPGVINDPETLSPRQIRALQHELHSVKTELDKANKMLDIMGKAHALYEMISASADSKNK